MISKSGRRRQIKVERILELLGDGKLHSAGDISFQTRYITAGEVSSFLIGNENVEVIELESIKFYRLKPLDASNGGESAKGQERTGK